ncbi:MAG: MMPL family transporter [Polyangiales bacterium]
MTEKPKGLLAWIVNVQVNHPWLVLLVALIVTTPAFLLARKLELRTGFESLLPENKPSVQELERVGKRTAGVATLSLVIDGSDKKKLQEFGDALLPKLRALGDPWVGTAEDGVQAEKEFLRRRQALFLPLAKVQELHDKIEDRYDYEVNGSLMDDEPPEAITRATIEKELGIDKKKEGEADGPPYPDGYYMDAAGKRLVVLVRTKVSTGELDQIAVLRQKVEAVVADVKPAQFDPSIKVSYTGDVVTSAEQYGAVKDDLASVGIVGIGLILLVDFLFFLRLRAVLAMALAIGCGVFWTFAITKLVIGHLNTASGFLVSIVFGNGINYGVLYRARYNEARRHGSSMADAIGIAHAGTWRPTLTVAAAAGAGYVSLASTNFRGFRDFGTIGGYGMVLCWIANYAFMPPLLVVFEKIWPTGKKREGVLGKISAFIDHGIPFGAPFAWLTRVVPSRALAAIGLASALAGGWLSYKYVKNDPLEYDTGKLGNDAVGGDTPAALLSEQVDKLVGRSGQDGMAVMVDRLDQVQPYAAELQKRWEASPAGQKPFEKVVTIYNLVPPDQTLKIELLRDVRKKIDRVHDLGKISETDWKDLEPFLPPADITEFDVKDLPERVARPFTENDKSVGRIIYIVPTEGRSVRDVKYLLQWADSFRETKLPTGETILGTGRAVIFADMLKAVIEESPRAIVLSFGMTALVVAIAFARGGKGIRAISLVLGALITGIFWMGAALALGKVKINFLNFIAVPITFGIGVDYAINVVHRWRIEGTGSVLEVVRETGGAVVLCSLTTTLGYCALLTSINGAVRSFGLVAVIGEMTCLTAAVILLPAVLVWIDGTKTRPTPTNVN